MAKKKSSSGESDSESAGGDLENWDASVQEVLELLEKANRRQRDRQIGFAIQTLNRVSDLKLLSNLGPTALRILDDDEGGEAEVAKALKILKGLVDATSKKPVNRPIRPRQINV